MLYSLTFHITFENLTFFSLWWTSLFWDDRAGTNFIINDFKKAVVQVSHRRLAIKKVEPLQYKKTDLRFITNALTDIQDCF